ncbi:hypothetical protein FJ955_02025 [Mesorhizobium sp. B2-2-2]|uniref:hypothetical protein n=1 Tax=Mesorhizobium sp. B2-2-2 TaxID=2589964 RepID=UPI001128FBF9|nr:hypothetical protein [Mesorhizobium sp. B2-2-2]TPM33549.1 hypothetical protein FJ955_02025 [Mesorhizobium sp. B2-2-2]
MQKVIENLHESAPLVGNLGTTIFIVTGIALIVAARHFIRRADIAKAAKLTGYTSLAIAVGGALVDAGIAAMAS